MRSVMQRTKECYLCRKIADRTGYYGELNPNGLQEHHVISGNGRKSSERLGLKVWLCVPHHIYGEDAVHTNRKVELELKREAQELYEQTHTREEWLTEFGKSWL